VDNGYHAQTVFFDPAGYEQHIVSFFKGALAGDK
jgi:hypothetical protein